MGEANRRAFYRPEIDGLRAIAVLSVVIYHARFDFADSFFLQGGFLGVDIFFVISGYLISKIILTEIDAGAGFSFRHFYERRARRILPALFVVMLVSFPYAWSYLLPSDFIEYSKSVLASLVFGSNYYFYAATTEYGADSALLKPFLHTWSLSVEEQFYILFPVLLIALSSWFKKYRTYILLAVLVVSLQFSEMMLSRNVDLNFYLLPSRVWELLAGTMIAVMGNRVLQRRELRVLPSIGLALLLYAIYSFKASTGHPGYATIIPILGTCLIVLFSSQHDIVGRVLGSKPFVGVGLISYSLYLWHFPVFAFARVRNDSLNVDDKISLIAISVVLAVVSYFLIEKPFRNRTYLSNRKLIVILLSVFGLLMGMNALVIQKAGFSDRLSGIFSNEKITIKPSIDLRQNGQMCYERRDRQCVFENTESENTVALLGDSHLASIQKDLVSRLSPKYTVRIATLGGCWPLRDFDVFLENGTKDWRCSTEVQNWRLEQVAKEPGSIVVVGARLPLTLSSYYFDNQEGGYEDGFYRQHAHKDETYSTGEGVVLTIEELLENGHEVVLIYPTPAVGWDVPRKLLADMPKELWKQKEYLRDNPLTTSYAVYQERAKESFEVLDRLEHENLYRVYPHKLFCDNQIPGRCVTHDTEHMYYSDDDHPSYQGAAMINDLIMAQIEKIELKRASEK